MSGGTAAVNAGDRVADRVEVCAPAKINLFLHVGEKRPDGYHELESLIGFAEVGDRISVAASGDLSLAVRGPFARDLPDSDGNLALKAARAFQHRLNRRDGAIIRLEKNLPVASGIGGGSADAAAVLRGLALLWRADCSDAGLLSLAAELGSDVPACLLSRPCWVAGRGEILAELPELPRLATVLVNPGVGVATAAVFGMLNARAGLGKPRPARRLENLWDVIGYLGEAGNDLEAPACRLAPVIQEVLSAFDREPGCAMAAMSGSGATCFALFHADEYAHGAADRIAQDHPEWWVSFTRLAGLEIGRPRRVAADQ